MAAHGLSVVAFARAAGLPRYAVDYWFRVPEATVARRTLEALAQLLGLDADEALVLAGGVTVEQRRQEIGRDRSASGTLRRNAQSAEARQKRAATKRRQRELETPAQAAARRAAIGPKIREALRASPGEAANLERFGRWSASVEGRATHYLTVFLRRVPSPTREHLRARADELSRVLGVRAATILALWRPRLQAKGLAPRSGRKANHQRARLVDDLKSAAPRKANGALPAGFWNDAAAAVSQAEGIEIDGPSLRIWDWRRPVERLRSSRPPAEA
jgi:hypothetical protein